MSGLLKFFAVILLGCGMLSAIMLAQIHPLFLLLLVPEFGLAFCFWCVADIHERLIDPDIEVQRPKPRQIGKKYREPGQRAELGEPEDD